MLALAQAFMGRPRLLLVDELSLGLAPTVVGHLLEVLRTIHTAGTTVVLVEQSVNVALTLASRAYFMEKGQVRFEGATADLLHRDDVLRSVFLERANKSLDSEPKARTRSRSKSTEAASRTPVLEVRGLTKSFGGINAVTDVSFTVHEDESLGLIGPNGAGKTTIFDMISGHLPSNEGRIILNGQDITGWVPEKRAALGLGRSFQDARIFP